MRCRAMKAILFFDVYSRCSGADKYGKKGLRRAWFNICFADPVCSLHGHAFGVVHHLGGINQA